MSSEAFRTTMDDLSCEICMEMFDEARRRPKSLECGHTMCLSCIQRLGVCSWDRKEVENPDDLRDNYYLLRRIETNAARRFWCLECESVASRECEDEHRICSLKKFRTGEVREQSQCLEAAVELHRQVLSKLLSIHSELSSCIQRLVDDLTRDQSDLQDSLNRLQDILDNGGSQEAWLAARQRCGAAARRAEEVLPAIQREGVLLEHGGMLSLKLWDRAQRGICLGAHVSLAAEAETQEVLRLVLFLLNRSGQLVERSPVHAAARPPPSPPQVKASVSQKQQATHQRGGSQQNCNGEDSDLENRLANDEEEDGDDDWSDADEIEVLGACALQESEANERKIREREDRRQRYELMVMLDSQKVVPSLQERFECPVCVTVYGPGDGIVLRDCLHTFCRNCLADTVQFSQDAEVKCPYSDNFYSCQEVIQEREIKALVSAEVFEQYLQRSISQAENRMQNTFHCKTPDCAGWCVYENAVNFFICPVCFAENCLTCQVMHPEENCAHYQARIKAEAQTNEDARRTQAQLEEMLQNKTAMKCPSCQIVIMKRAGCDSILCSMCKTQICWATRGPRWGPKGHGDTSGGCRCGVNGKCHPQCGNCH